MYLKTQSVSTVFIHRGNQPKVGSTVSGFCCGSMNISLRSSDLSPLDFYLWGYKKAVVYCSRKRYTVQYCSTNCLEESTERAISVEVYHEWEKLCVCLQRDGIHAEDVL